MNSVDAIEGTAKCIIDKMYGIFFEGIQDDTEYVRNAKAVITGTETFVQAQPEDAIDFEVLQKRLYDYAKERWLSFVQSIAGDSAGNGASRDPAFYEYYFDYVYHHGIFPP